MKILYITSGVTHPYPHKMIDKYIAHTLQVLTDKARVFQLNKSANWQASLWRLVKEFQPDFVLTIHGGNMSRQVVQQLQTFGAKVAIWFVDDPYDVDDSLRKLYGYDFVFTNEQSCLKLYQQHGYKQTAFLPLGTVPEFFFKQKVEKKYHSDICFLGSPFPTRVKYLRFLAQRFPRSNIKVVGPHWLGRLGRRKLDIVERYVEPDEMRKFYNGAKINLNIYREINEHIMGRNLNSHRLPPLSPNNRTFDIAACQAFQLSNFRPTIEQYMDLKRELIIFQNQVDLVKKISYYLTRPRERELIVRAAFQRTLREHCLKNRLQQMISIVKGGKKMTVKDQTFADIKRWGKLMKGASAGVYFVYAGLKYLVPDKDTFHRLNLSWDDVVVVPQAQIDAIPLGGNIEN